MKRLKTWASGLLLVLIGVTAGMAGQGVTEQSPSRRVECGETDVISVKTKVRFTTLIVLPKEETILDFTCGDKEFWVVDGTKNLAYIKPAKTGARTNINLVTAAGNVYSFVLEEVSDRSGEAPDLKLFVAPKEDSVISAMKGEPRFVAAEEVVNFRDQVSIAKEEAREAALQAEQKFDARITRFLAEYPASLKFDYQFVAGKKPFFVSSIWNDGRFTYVRINAGELPAFYEIRDGKPNLVNFDFRDGVITVQKVVDGGYLSIGKAKLYFHRKETKQP